MICIHNIFTFWQVLNINYFIFLLCSYWALATSEELEEALANWKKKIDDGTANEVIKEVKSFRRKLGETTTIVAFKGLN